MTAIDLPDWLADGSTVYVRHMPNNGWASITEVVIERHTATQLVLADGRRLRRPTQPVAGRSAKCDIVGTRTCYDLHAADSPELAKTRTAIALRDARSDALGAADKAMLNAGNHVTAEQAREAGGLFEEWAVKLGAGRLVTDGEEKALTTVEVAEALAGRAAMAIEQGEFSTARELLAALVSLTSERTVTAVKDQDLSDRIAGNARKVVLGEVARVAGGQLDTDPQSPLSA